VLALRRTAPQRGNVHRTIMAQQFDVYEGAIFALPCTARTSEIERSLSRTLSDYASLQGRPGAPGHSVRADATTA